MPDTNTRQKRLYQAVANKIASLIDGGAYAPGTRLPGERALAEKFGVSRVIVREAMVSLQTLGRVEIRTGSGVYVLEGGERESDLPPEVSAFELTQARMLIESEAAALAAPDIGQATLERLEALLAVMETSESEEEANLADRDFHLAIARASENNVVLRIVEWLWKMRMEQESIRQAYHEVCSRDLTNRGEEHAEVLEALRAHDAEASRLAMRRHFRRLIESMLDATEERALAEVRKKAVESRLRYLKGAA